MRSFIAHVTKETTMLISTDLSTWLGPQRWLQQRTHSAIYIRYQNTKYKNTQNRKVNTFCYGTIHNWYEYIRVKLKACCGIQNIMTLALWLWFYQKRIRLMNNELRQDGFFHSFINARVCLRMRLTDTSSHPRTFSISPERFADI